MYYLRTLVDNIQNIFTFLSLTALILLFLFAQHTHKYRQHTDLRATAHRLSQTIEGTAPSCALKLTIFYGETHTRLFLSYSYPNPYTL